MAQTKIHSFEHSIKQDNGNKLIKYSLQENFKWQQNKELVNQ